MSPAGVAHLALGAAIGSSERVEFGRGSTRGGGKAGKLKLPYVSQSVSLIPAISVIPSDCEGYLNIGSPVVVPCVETCPQ